MTFSQAFLFVIDDLKVLGLLVRYFKECSSTAIYLIFVLMIRLWNSTEVKCCFHHITSKVHIINMAYHYCVNFMTWLRECLSGFPTVKLWELDHKEGRTTKNWCLWTVVLKKTPESPLDSNEIKPVNLKGNQPWILRWKDWCWSWSASILVIWYKQPTHWKSPCFWERLRARDQRVSGWDG